MDRKDHIDIHLMEESRTDKQGNEWYKKMEMVIRKKQLGSLATKNLMPHVNVAIYFFICVLLFVLIFIKPLFEDEPDVTSAELETMIKSAEGIEGINILDFFEQKLR